MAVYVAAAGVAVAMYGIYQQSQYQSAQARYQAQLADEQRAWNQSQAEIQANNIRWQAEYNSMVAREKADLGVYEAELTGAQAEAMAGSARQKRDISEQKIVLTETQAFDELAKAIGKARAGYGASGVRVGTGTPISFLAATQEKRTGDIQTQSKIYRSEADLSLSDSLFSSDILRAKGTIQLDEANLGYQNADFITKMGLYNYNQILAQANRNNTLLGAQASIYRGASDQALTAGWLNAAGAGARGAYNISRNSYGTTTESGFGTQDNP